jgi:hypothetical protein
MALPNPAPPQIEDPANIVLVRQLEQAHAHRLVLKMRNESVRSRRPCASGYAEWMIGDRRAISSGHLITAIDLKSGAWPL